MGWFAPYTRDVAAGGKGVHTNLRKFGWIGRVSVEDKVRMCEGSFKTIQHGESGATQVGGLRNRTGSSQIT